MSEINPATLRPYPPDHPDGLRALPDFGVYGAAIQKAVEDYLLMERKARAWDELRRQYAPLIGMAHAPEVVACMDALVQPAQERSS